MNLSRRQKIGLSVLGTSVSAELAAVAFWTSNEIANDPIDCRGYRDQDACIVQAEQERASDQVPHIAIGAIAVVMATIGGAITVELISKKEAETNGNAAAGGWHETIPLTAHEYMQFEEIVRYNDFGK